MFGYGIYKKSYVKELENENDRQHNRLVKKNGMVGRAKTSMLAISSKLNELLLNSKQTKKTDIVKSLETMRDMCTDHAGVLTKEEKTIY